MCLLHIFYGQGSVNMKCAICTFMENHMLTRTLLPCLLLVSACAMPEIQNTSGKAYLAAGPIADREIAAAAAYEPKLTLPARIGIVRLVYDKFTTIPEKELDLILAELPAGLGEMTQLGPLDARITLNEQHPRSTQKNIRKLAASRHLDYVLVLSFHPGNNTAEALMLDVRTGYPYASTEAAVTGSGIRNFWGNEVRNSTRVNRTTLRLTKALTPKLHQLAQQLIVTARK